MDTKTCSKCGIEKDTSEFYKEVGSNDGFRGQCKECMKRYCKEWRLKNPEKSRDCMARYSKTEKFKQTHAKWRAKNRESLLKKSKTYRSTVTKNIRLDNTMEQYFEYLNTIEEQND